jgi:hypothetical protein
MRRLLKIGALVSVIAGALLLAATIRTFFVSDRFATVIGGLQVNVATYPGQFRIDFNDDWAPKSGWVTRPPEYILAGRGMRHQLLGLAGEGSQGVGMTKPWYYATHYVVPAIYPLLALLVLPVLWWRGEIRRRRLEKLVGVCRHCHYDLRAHKPGDKCPECGNLIN